MYISRTKNLLLSKHGAAKKKQWHPYDIKNIPEEKTAFCFQNEVVSAINRAKPNYRTSCSDPRHAHWIILPVFKMPHEREEWKTQCRTGADCGQTAMLILKGTWGPHLDFLFPSTMPTIALGFLTFPETSLDFVFSRAPRPCLAFNKCLVTTITQKWLFIQIEFSMDEITFWISVSHSYDCEFKQQEREWI